MKKRAILYTRVSTDEQAIHGYSLRDQYDKLKAYCNVQGIEVVTHFQDDHSAKTFERPAFIKLLDYLKRNKNCADILLFIKWDRFSRNAPNSYEMIKHLKKYNIEPQAMEQPLDFRIPESKIMLAIYLSSPEVENDRRSINVINGMRRALKEGRWMNKAPKGYDNKRDENNRPIIVQNKDAKLVHEAFELISTGEFSQEQVLRRLRIKGFNYHHNSFSELLRNPVYMGKVLVKGYNGEPEEIVQGIHQPIVSEDLFYQVQDVIDGKRRGIFPQVHSGKDELPLRGFLICPICGKKLTGSASKGNGGKYYYYHCLHGCKWRNRANTMNELFENYLKTLSFSKQSIELYNKILKTSLEEGETGRKDNAKVFEEEMKKIQTRIDNLQDMLADGQILSSDYNSAKERYEEKLRDLRSKKEDVTILNKDIYEQLVFSFSFMSDLPSQYSKASLDVKQRIIGSIFPENIIFSENKYRTTRINEVVKYFWAINKGLHRNEKGEFCHKTESPLLVLRAGLEPARSQ